MTKYFIHSLILFLLLTLNTYSDVMFEMEYKSNNSELSNNAKAQVKNNLLKMDYFEGSTKPSTSLIFNSDLDKMITLDHDQKTYFVMDKETMTQISNHMNSAMAEMEEAMKDMSPEEKEMMQKMMKGKMHNLKQQNEYVEPVLKESGKTKINGYDCIKYDVYKGSDMIRQHCVTAWSNIEGGTEIQNTILKMSKFMEEFQKSFKSGSNMFADSIEFDRNVFIQLNKLNGFPVQTVDYYNGSITFISTFNSSKITNIDPNNFELPADYKQQKMNM